MVNLFKKFGAAILLLGAILFFYSPLLTSQKLPIPSDTIIGLYNPFRDLYAIQNPNGISYKNFLITDPVRQTFIWKELVVESFQNGTLPSWNPYEMTGKPLIGNFQSAAFYPLNIFLLFFSFSYSWSFLIMAQSMLFGVFMYLYLKNLKLNSYSSLIGSLCVTFSSFSIVWLEWGTIISTALWLPVILLSLDKIFVARRQQLGVWLLALFIGFLCSFFAGHLQTFLYLYLVSTGYFILRWIEYKRESKTLLFFFLINIFVIIATFIQWFPTLRFILLSSRNIDQNFATIEGWFIPWRHLIQFLAPDFFGNPSTLNYWGTWNYGELTNYIGIVPLVFAYYALYKRDKIINFFLFILFLSLLFALPTGISSIPFILKIPLIATAQPTRLIFPIVFSLSVLASFGCSYLMSLKKTTIRSFLPIFLTGLFYVVLWLFVFTKSNFLFGNEANMLVAKRNLVFPFSIFCIFSLVLFIDLKIKSAKFRSAFILLFIFLTIFDQLRFAQKFTPFTSISYLFPNTSALTYLKEQKGLFRVAVLDRQIMPPNFFTYYKLQTIEGYDPLYLKNYAEFIAALERNKPDISIPFGFNRIITPHNYNSPLYDLLNTKYVLSLDEIHSEKLVKVFEEGKTKIYENKNVQPRLFFVEKIVPERDGIASLFENDLRRTAIVESKTLQAKNLSVGLVSQVLYKENIINMKTENSGDGYLVFTDAYYPTWSATIDGVKTKIYLTNHAFRGVFVPKGTHTVQFKDSLL